MKKTVALIASLFVSSQVRADPFEIKTPADLVHCVHNFINNFTAFPEQVGTWEHEPAFIFFGKYVHASWWTDATRTWGALGLQTGSHFTIYCDFETNSDGTPVHGDQGFCKSTVPNGDIKVEIMHISGARLSSEQQVIGQINNSKILCHNLAMP